MMPCSACEKAVQQQLAFSRGDAHGHCLLEDSQGLHTASAPTHDARQSCCGRLLCPPDPNPLRGADDADDDSSSVSITSSSSDPDSSDTRASFLNSSRCTASATTCERSNPAGCTACAHSCSRRRRRGWRRRWRGRRRRRCYIQMTVQRARPVLHTAATGVTPAVDALHAHDTTSPARRCKTVKQSLVMLELKLHGDWTQYRASMHASKP